MSLLQVNTPAAMHSGTPAKIPLGGRAEQNLCHPAVGGNAETAVTGENARRQEGMSGSTAPGVAGRGYGAALPALCRSALLPARDACGGVPSTVKYCSCATARHLCKTFQNWKFRKEEKKPAWSDVKVG